jgi:hypothetical protein
VEHHDHQPANSWIRSAVAARIAVAVAIAAATGGLVLWGLSTRTANPISGKGIGFEGVGVGGLRVGYHAVFMGFLVGRSLDSRATVNGYALPHIPGARLALYAVRRPPHVSLVGVPTVTAYGTHGTPPDAMVPLVGRALGPPPAWLHTHHPVLMVALDVTLLRRGCVHIDGGVQVSYRAGDTTFTRSMDGDDSAGTDDSCWPA